MIYAVIDTNIFVSSFITKSSASPTRRVINSLFDGKIKPLYNDDILQEYEEVLLRKKFQLAERDVKMLLDFIKVHGINSTRYPYDGNMPDDDDRVFYEVALSEEDSFLVTGNLENFPRTLEVVTAALIIEIIDQQL